MGTQNGTGMKIGIVSDIHASPQALRRTLEDMPAVDKVLCAGDAISDYRFCAETVDILQRARVQCIQGNHETGLFGGRNPDYLRKCQREFAPELLDFLASAPLSLELEAAGAKVLMVHASPWRPIDEYIYPHSPTLARFAQLPYDFVIFGHTHVPLVHRANTVTVINPGSCSQPRDPDRRGSYAILDLERRVVELRRVLLH
jgi:putative phosphoesterase